MDPLTVVMLGILGLLVFFMFRNSRKRKQEMEVLQLKMVPGAEVMTNFGLFGTLVSIDEEQNIATIETGPGTTVRVHRQTLARVIEDDVVAEAAEAGPAEEPQLNASSLDAPTEKPKRGKKSEG